jgi:hypothetical protein
MMADSAAWLDQPSALTRIKPDARRWLQLSLAAIWLLDGLLQLQSFMFTTAFGQSLAATARGNPALIAGPITWSSHLIEAHPAWANTTFASIQIFLGLGIAWRPTLKAALAGSVAWSLGVWWFGEGLGGVFTSSADPAAGAPGAVIIYGLLAVLLWPVDRPGPFEAARPFGPRTARLLWLALWGGLACLAIEPADRTAQGLHNMVFSMAAGEPGWIVALDRSAASLLDGRGLLTSVMLAVVLAVIAAGIFLPPPAARAAVLLAAAVALIIWVVGENFGAILAGSGTDPNTGPLLVLLAAAYWPEPHRARSSWLRRVSGHGSRVPSVMGGGDASGGDVVHVTGDADLRRQRG